MSDTPNKEPEVQAAHTPVPVAEAKRIADLFNKNAVVILSYDPESGRTHTTTYGTTPPAKHAAAYAGDACTKLLCGKGFDWRETYEDFRGDATLQARCERLEAKLARVRDWLKSCSASPGRLAVMEEISAALDDKEPGSMSKPTKAQEHRRQRRALKTIRERKVSIATGKLCTHPKGYGYLSVVDSWLTPGHRRK